MRRVVVTVTAEPDIVGSYFETLLGIFAVADLLISYKASKRTNPETGMVTVLIDANMYEPPISDIGTSDIPDAKS